MAIGDTLNQNLFGTNYNAEEEERKKAELAAQGAIMGAGNIPASAFGQAPAVNPFSMEAAGQVNPMMQPQNLESFAQPQVTFRDYDVPATPPASALSVFTPGGEVKPNVDVNAITPSPETTSTSAVNTALNQEVAVGLPSIESSEESVRLARSRRPRTGESSQNVVLDFLSGTDYGGTRTGRGRARRDDNITTQAPSGASALEATQGVTPPVERPTAGAQEQPGAVVSPFLQSPDTPSGLGGPLLRGFEMVNDAARGPNAPMGQDATRAALGGMTLNEYLNAPAGTPGVSGLRTDPQGRMIPAGFETRAEAFPDFERESAAREARLDARPDFGEAISDRDRRAARGDGISMADQVDMAKANARGATPREVARGNQVANALGVDLKTGQPLQTAGGLTFDQQLALRKQNFAEGKFDYELAKDAQATYTAGIEASQKATTEEAQADTAGKTMVSAISNMNDAMTRMGGRSGEFFGSGFFGKAASFIPGTSAYDQVADVEFLQSNVALNAMAELKELSPTGSTGFGALSEKELRVLTDKYANLNPFTSPDLFQKNLKQLQGEFNNMLNNAWNKHSKEYGPEAANAIYGNRGGSGATGAPSQAVPNDRNVASAADTLLSDPKYN